MRNLVISLFLCMTLGACNTTNVVETHGSTSSEAPDGQLPGNVVPQRYDVHLTMDPDRQSFTGHAEIEVELTTPEDTLWLHGWELRVDDVVVELVDGRKVSAQYEQVNDTGLAKLVLDETVGPQRATLVFDYSADYFSGLDGAYRVNTGDEWYVFTQFEPVHARRVFPAFDEPAFKTPFEMQFTIPGADKVVANTPLKEKTALDNGMVRYRFEATKPLPTYLVAFAIGPLDIVDAPAIPPNAIRDRPIPLRGVAVKGKGEQFDYALKHTGEMVAILEDYFGIPYPYEKLDIIAVPDFSAGAMENAGAITFREVYLLIPDPENAPTWQLHAYAEVMAHELAHQWFGNLVTMPWWDDIWLNEAFASWMEGKVVEQWNPEHPVDQDTAGTIAYAMSADSLTNARQIRQPIKSTHDIENAFDGITYSKGSAVLQMFEKYLGEDVFREGVRYHLERFEFGNADVFDFLDSLSHAAGKDVTPAFRSFLFQPGIPLVDVDLNCGEDVTVSLAQSRYLPLGSDGARDKMWVLPVCMKLETDTGISEQCVQLDQRQETFELKAASCPEWIMPNADGVGYYHWTLSGENFADLMRATKKLNLLELLALERSIKAGFEAGQLDTGKALGALERLTRSQYFEVSEAPMSLVATARNHLVDNALHDELAAYARHLYKDYSLADEFTPGKAPADPVERGHHVSVAAFLARYGNDRMIRSAAAKAGRALVGYGNDGKVDFDAITPDYMSLALGVAVEESDDAFFEHLVTLFKNSDNALTRRLVLRALGNASAPALTKRIETLLLDPALRRNEVPSLLGAYSREPENRAAAWNWLRDHYDTLVNRMAPDHASRLPFNASGFCSEERAREVEAFFATRSDKLPGGPRNLAKTVETIELCAAQKKAQSESASAFFSSMSDSQPRQ